MSSRCVGHDPAVHGSSGRAGDALLYITSKILGVGIFSSQMLVALLSRLVVFQR